MHSHARLPVAQREALLARGVHVVGIDNVNSYYDDPHAATGQFDFVLANPPFNVNAWTRNA